MSSGRPAQRFGKDAEDPACFPRLRIHPNIALLLSLECIRMFGSHLSISGGLHNALLSAEKFGMETVQIFTKNQQQWKCKPLEKQIIDDWKSHCSRLRFSTTISHDSY